MRPSRRLSLATAVAADAAVLHGRALGLVVADVWRLARIQWRAAGQIHATHRVLLTERAGTADWARVPPYWRPPLAEVIPLWGAVDITVDGVDRTYRTTPRSMP